MTELTYAQASVLCRVEGMPYEQFRRRENRMSNPEEWIERPTGPDRGHASMRIRSRLTPSASLTPDQAAICLAMGVAVEVHYGNGGKWRPCRIGDCCPSVHGHSTTSLRVPPESEEA